jgi:hypothetical protein
MSTLVDHKMAFVRQKIADLQAERPELSFRKCWDLLRKKEPGLFTDTPPRAESGVAAAMSRAGFKLEASDVEHVQELMAQADDESRVEGESIVQGEAIVEGGFYFDLHNGRMLAVVPRRS